MKPLHYIGAGLVFLVLHARAGGYDLYPDPVGWLLVMIGLAGVVRVGAPELQRRRTALWYLAITAAVISVALWLPAGHRWISDAEPALGWAADLPRLSWCALLAWALADAAREAKESTGASWFSAVALVLAAVAAAPVLIFGVGWSALAGPAVLAAQVGLLGLLVLVFVYSGRPWAGGADTASDDDG